MIQLKKFSSMKDRNLGETASVKMLSKISLIQCMYLQLLKLIFHVLSRPLPKIATWRYWLRLSRDVYDGNRSFASYTKTKAVESDV